MYMFGARQSMSEIACLREHVHVAVLAARPWIDVTDGGGRSSAAHLRWAVLEDVAGFQKLTAAERKAITHAEPRTRFTHIHC